MTILWCALAAVNLAAFLLMGVDKRRAVKGKWRIPERMLLLPAFLGGAAGGLLGLLCFRHKTRHLKFTVLLPTLLLVQGALLLYGLAAAPW